MNPRDGTVECAEHGSPRDNMPAYASEVALLDRMAGRQAADALRAPFVLGNRKDLATLFSDAGVATVDITTHQGTARFPSIRTMVEAECRRSSSPRRSVSMSRRDEAP